MRRVTDPLVRMGASVAYRRQDGLPLTIRGGPLQAIEWELPVSSAQLKSAVLLAGLAAGVEVKVREPGGLSRDHTERMLRALGCSLEDAPDGWITFRPPGRLAPFTMGIPGDLSSAAFLVGAATLAKAGQLVIREVGLNPTRSGFLDVLQRMGGEVQRLRPSERLGEPVGDLMVRPAGLRATRVTAEEIPGLIDEIPMLAVLAGRAEGTTVFDQVGELRVKESDRLALLARNLTAVGVEATASENRLTVVGTDRPPRGRVITAGDHRLAMAFSILGVVAGARVEVDDPGCVDVSFPGFFDTLKAIGGRR
jgi:3-phosphoshikimate 1-carboxyvinyltransferase